MKSERFEIRWPPALLAELDAWCAGREPPSTRSAAVKFMVKDWLKRHALPVTATEEISPKPPAGKASGPVTASKEIDLKPAKKGSLAGPARPVPKTWKAKG